MATKKALVYDPSTDKVLTFNSNNVWVDTGLAKASLTDQNFISVGFDPTILSTTLSCIYVNFNDNGVLGTDGGELWLTDDIDKNLGVTAETYVDSDTQPKVQLTIPNFLPKDQLNSNDIILIYDDDTNYAPEILSTSFSATSTHNQSIILTAQVQYLYNKNISYRIRIGSDYTSSWSTSAPITGPLNIEITTNHLKVGANDIALDVADDTQTHIGTVSLTGAITLTDSAPNVSLITAESNSFKVHFIISDSDSGDTVQYRLTLSNSKINKVVADWTTLITPPIDIIYQFDSTDTVVNETNILTIDTKDNLGQTYSASYSFIGDYKNILFLDETGKPYSTDKAVQLIILNFGEIIGGRTSITKKITLKNNNDYAIENIKISKINNTPSIVGLYIELSKSNNPFIPLDELDFGDQQLAYKDTLDFYARVRTDDTAVGLDNFQIDVHALPVS